MRAGERGRRVVMARMDAVGMAVGKEKEKP